MSDNSLRLPWTHEPYGDQNQNGDYSGGSIFDADGEYVVVEVSDDAGAAIVAAMNATHRPSEPPPACAEHKPVQHRDGKPPWCKRCGLTADFQTPVSRFARTPAAVECPTCQCQGYHATGCPQARPNIDPSEDDSLDGLTEGQLADEMASWDY
jgi:hypothetical protein